MSMGNGSVVRVLGEGQVQLQLLFRKVLTLDGVFHISNIRKNLISASLLLRNGYKVVSESNKVVITRLG